MSRMRSAGGRAMARIARKSDGRRIYSAEFKQEQIGHVVRGELTLSELSRKLGIARSLLQRWKRQVAASVNGLPVQTVRAGRASGLRSPDFQVAELQRLIGKQAVELDNLRGELDAMRAARRAG